MSYINNTVGFGAFINAAVAIDFSLRMRRMC